MIEIQHTDDETLVKTPSGIIENGSASHRHFVRAVEQIDGLGVVCSFSSDRVSLSVRDTTACGPLVDLAEDHGVTLEIEGNYSDGDIKITASLGDNQ